MQSMKRKALGFPVALLGTVFLLHCSRPPHGPLRVSEENPRYFTDGSGRAVYLTGSHTWNNLVDMDTQDPPKPFDFDAYLDFLAEYNHNFIRLWTWELLGWDTQANREDDPKTFRVSPHPWERTGPGQASDGKPKFDLTRLDPIYFQRLHDRVSASGKKGIYVSVMLFEGWGIQFSPDAFRNHPFHPANNINDVGLDSAGVRKGLEIHELGDPKILALQEAYVKKMIETVSDCDNVLFEISNENHPESTEWQYHMIRFIQKHEEALGKRHPVGMTFQYRGGSNLTLFESPADWISPNGEGGYRIDPPPSDGRKVILNDTDHLWGIGGNAAWVWKSFLRGMNPLFMDPYDGSVLKKSYDSSWVEPLRRAMGQTLRYAQKMDLLHMEPADSLASSGYCLANRGREYLVYLPDGNGVDVNLSDATGRMLVEWFDPRRGQTEAGERVEGGGNRHFSSPFAPGESVLYLKRE